MIGEAIRILDRHYNLHLPVSREELDTASKLGIEALERIEAVRQGKFWSGNVGVIKLPSETEEQK